MADVGGDDFDVRHWLNRTLAADGAGRAAVSDKVQDTIGELQLLIHMSMQRLDKLSGETLALVPRTLLDIEAAQRDADQLTAALDAAQQRAGDDEVNEAFARLSLMDRVLHNMESTRACLKETENWSTLAAEMDAILASQDFDKAAARLAEARRSLTLLSASSAFEERQALLAKMLEDLLALMAPQALTALDARDADATQHFESLYAQLDRAADFERMYALSRCEPLLKAWADPGDIADDPVRLQHLIERMGALVSLELGAGGASIEAAAGAPDPSKAAALGSLLEFVLHNMSPRLPAWLRGVCEARLARSDGTALPTVVRMFAIACDFVQDVHQRLGPAASESGLGGKDAESAEHVPPWVAAILDAFLPIQRDYAALERRGLKALLSGFGRADQGAMPSMLQELSGRAAAACEATLLRCEQLTFGHGISVAAQAVDEYLAALGDAATRMLQGLQESTQVSALIAAGVAAGLKPLTDASMDAASGDDWADFRAAIAVHNVVVSMHSQHQMLVSAIERSAKNCAEAQRTAQPTDSLARVFLAQAIAQGRVRFAVQPVSPRQEPGSAEDGADERCEQLPASARALDGAALASQRLVFGCLLRRISKHLEEVPGMACWHSAPKDMSSPFGLELPQFSLLPLSYMTRIGEQLLALLQHLDTFVGEPSLRFRVEALPGLLREDVASAAENAAGEDMDLTHLWVTAVARAIEAQFADKVLQIAVLSAHGCKQLATDIHYLANVFAAMEISLHPRLAQIAEHVEASEADLQAAVVASGDAGGAAADRDLVQRIAHQRGLLS